MSAIINLVLSSIFGAFIGSLVFGLFLAVCMAIYIYLYYSFSVDFALGSLTVDNPIRTAFYIGFFFGGVQGFCSGLVIKSFDILVLSKGILISLVITEVLIAIFFLFTSFDFNPIVMMGTAFIERFHYLVKTSLVILVPTIVTGGIVTKAISYIIAR